MSTETLIKIVPDFQVSNVNNPYDPSITDLANGEFIVTWTAYNPELTNSEIYRLRYNENGTPIGQVFRVNTSTRNQENNSLRGHYGQLYNLNGSKRGELFQLDLGTAITALTNGGFVVTGEVYNAQDETSRDLYSQQYNANAQPVGQALRINTVRELDQQQVDVTPLTNRGFAATWESNQDGNTNIYSAVFNQGETGNITLEGTSYSIQEDGTPITTVTLVRTGGSDGDVEVTLMLNDGTATASYDYDDTPIAVSFAPGETRKTVIVPIVNDDRLEADETINLSVLDLTRTTSTQATLTIIDNDENNLSQRPAIRVGSELQINTTADGNTPLVMTLADGGFLVTWNRDFNFPGMTFPAGNEDGIAGQRYDANGEQVGEEFIISEVGKVFAVTDLTDGGFLATWLIYGTFVDQIYGQRYNASANQVGETFQVTTNTNFSSLGSPQITSLANGEFAIVWQEYSDLKGLRFDASNNPIGQPFLIDTGEYSLFYSYDPFVATLADGGFVVTWTSYLPDGSETGIYGQRYDAAVNAIGSEFQVNTYTIGQQENSAIAALTDGGFVVTWESTRQAESDLDIYTQRYDSLGNPVGQEFWVNTNKTGEQKNATVTSLSNGGFVVTWESEGMSGYGQQYDANSNPVGQEFRININHSLENPSITYLSNERFFVAWEGFGINNIYGQIFQPVTGLEVFSFAQLARSGFIDGLTFDPIEVGGLSLTSLYDETYYLNQNPDVAAAVKNGILSYGYTHFVDFGQFEGRNPSSLYNEALYLAQNPDVAEAVETDLFSSGFQHYALLGHKEGRSPSDLFNEQAYQAANPDVADAVIYGGVGSGFEHYLESGEAEGRSPLNFLYNESNYLIQNPDVAEALISGFFLDGFQHYINFGQTEKRNPSRLFDESQYLEQNSDVANAVNAGLLKSGFEHYILYGRAEGREV